MINLKNTFGLILTMLMLMACDKEAKRNYKMAGTYEVSKITQLVYTNGVLTSQNEYQDIGFIELRMPQTSAVNEFNGAFHLENNSVPIIAFKELNNKYVFNWESNWDDKRISFVWTDFLYEYGLTFTITKNKRNMKELFFVYSEIDDNDNLIEHMEFYTLVNYP